MRIYSYLQNNYIICLFVCHTSSYLVTHDLFFQEIGLTDAELQLLTIQGHRKPLNNPPPGTEEESGLLAVSSFEWTLHDKNPVSLTTL